jgi:dUTP pyrophosphatase
MDESISPRFFVNSINIVDDIPVLRMAVLDESLKKKYIEKAEKHNSAVQKNEYADSGFDLITPEDTKLEGMNSARLIDMKIKCEMVNKKKCVGYYIYPRSSIYKTPLMLANSVGIIDSGYRGNIKLAVRLLEEKYIVEKETRLSQICMSSLEPFYVDIIEEEKLTNTARGGGGFGSTGK